MALINYSGAPAAPATPSYSASLGGISGLRAVYSAASQGVVLDGAGRALSVAPIATAGGNRNFGATSGAVAPAIARGQGLACLNLANARLAGLTTDFGGNTVLTQFCKFHFQASATTGNILGDFCGTRFGIELGGTDSGSGLTRVRARSSAYIDVLTRAG